MSRHHVKCHHWYNGVLKTVDHFFDNLHEAMDFANATDSHHVKVYDHTGDLVHVVQNTPTGPSYA